MSELKRLRDFKAAKDDASAEELRRQLVTFEGNVSDMGDRLKKLSMQRLSAAPGTVGIGKQVIAPGQFQVVDTRLGTIPISLAKPTSADSGTFVMLIDIGGSAGSIRVQCDRCTLDLQASSIITAANFTVQIFCDGSNYWRVL